MKTAIDKANLLGKRLVVGLRGAVASLLADWDRDYGLNFRDQADNRMFALEMLAFHMYVIDRSATTRLSAADLMDFRSGFMDAVVATMCRGLEVDPQTPQGAKVAKSVLKTGRSRFPQYAACKLYPEKGESATGTLFWEFSRVLFSLTNSRDHNPAGLSAMCLLVMHKSELLMRSTDVEEVLRG
ncbi:MAG: hypothetical protein ABSH22_11060 [Tepidisphaeraceae bacterium]|jgi:hypothetical protein